MLKISYGLNRYWSQLFCRVYEALGNVYKALDEVFAECDTWQKSLGEMYIDNGFFVKFFCRSIGKKITVTAETLLSAAVTFDKVSIFVECLLYQYSAKKSHVDLFTSSFAGCLGGTRQSLCRRHMVSWPVTFL